jgi:hypothetical protein
MERRTLVIGVAEVKSKVCMSLGEYGVSGWALKCDRMIASWLVADALALTRSVDLRPVVL